MKINISSLNVNKPSLQVEGDFDFSNHEFDPFHIKKINNCHVNAEMTYLNEDLYSLKLHIRGSATVPCAYTLEDVIYPFNINEEIFYKVDANEDVPSFYPLKYNEVDIDEPVLSLLITSIPFKVIKKGAKLPQSGKGFRFMSEEEYKKEKENKSSPFDVLDKIDIK